MKKIIAFVLIVTLLFMSLGIVGCSSPEVADEVLYGKVVTMDDNNTIAEAVAVKDEKIIFVGNREDAKKYIGKDTAKCDYDNNVIYPGFIDGHSHVGILSTMLLNGSMLSPDDMLRQDAETMKKFIEENPGQEIYKGFGFWLHENDEDPPTHEVLDKYASSEVPVVIGGGGGHAAILNQKAIDYFNIKDLIDTYGTDGIKVDENGEPTGYLVETPRFDVFQWIPVDKNDIKEFILTRQNEIIKQGFTTVCDAGIVETEKIPMVSAFQELADEGKLKIKFRALCEIADVSKEPLKEVEKIEELSKKCDNDYFKITGIKIFLDGVVEALTCWTLNPYTPDAGKGDDYYGYIRWNNDRKDELIKIIKYANEKGLQVHMHAIGEGAATYGLDCYEAVLKELPDVDARNALAHLSFETPDMIKRFADNKVIAVVNPLWSTWKASSKGDEIKVYGEEKAKEMYKIKSFIDAGVTTSFHTDSFGTVPELVYASATRKDPTAAVISSNYKSFSDEMLKMYPDEIRGKEECLIGTEALKCITRTPAYQLKEEDNLGSIETGKSADFVIYDVDFTDETVSTDVSCINASLKSMFSNGKMIFPANLV